MRSPHKTVVSMGLLSTYKSPIGRHCLVWTSATREPTCLGKGLSSICSSTNGFNTEISMLPSGERGKQVPIYWLSFGFRSEVTLKTLWQESRRQKGLQGPDWCRLALPEWMFVSNSDAKETQRLFEQVGGSCCSDMCCWGRVQMRERTNKIARYCCKRFHDTSFSNITKLEIFFENIPQIWELLFNPRNAELY